MKYKFRLFALLLCMVAVAPCTVNAQSCSQPFKVVVLGSSTAAGYRVANPNNAYVNLFRNYLINNVNAGCTVDNLAVAGFNTYRVQPAWFETPVAYPIDLTKNVDAALALNPDAILINLPTNDTRDNIPIATQKDNFLRLRGKIDSANIPLWVTSTQPRNFAEQARRNELMEMRDWLATTFGSRYIDFWTGLANPDGTLKEEYDWGDGTHLLPNGHALLFDRVVNSTLITDVCAIVLPVELHDFKVSAAGNGALLQWQASGLEDGAFFKVEYSLDGTTGWQLVTTISAADINGTGTGKFSYNHTTASSISAALYYRILTVNKDGTHKYSNIESVKFNQNKNIGLYLRDGKIVMFSQSQEPVQFVVYDYTGRPVTSGSFRNNTHTISLMQKGVFVVKLYSNPGQSVTQKIGL